MPSLRASFALVGAAVVQAQNLYQLGPAIPPKGPIERIPLLGLGSWDVHKNATEVVASAIKSGYRHIDTATIYWNQREIAPGIQEGLKRAGLKREDLWVTTKLWDSNHVDPEVGLKEGLNQLGLDYVDLWLMHWPIGDYPGGSRFDHVETWKKMEKLVGPDKPARRIGISNFTPTQLKELLAAATIKPYAHQLELHPYLQQSDFVDYHHANNISVVAYAPLGNTNPGYGWGYFWDEAAPPALLKNEVIVDIAQKYGCSPAQIVLAWNINRGVAVIPKASQLHHQTENLAVGRDLLEGCVGQLSEGDLKRIAAFKEKKGWVRRFNNPCERMAKLQCFTGLESPTTGI